MSIDRTPLPCHWSHFVTPPVGLPDEWAELFTALAGPADAAATFRLCETADLQPLHGLAVLQQRMSHALDEAKRKLSIIRGIAIQTWYAGHAIRSAVLPVFEAMCVICSRLPSYGPERHYSDEEVAAARRKLAEARSLDLATLLDGLAAAVEADFAAECVQLASGASRSPLDGPLTDEPQPPIPQYVTLDQIAAAVNHSKKSLERRKSRKDKPLPSPAVEGGGGKADEWIWSDIRPWLETEFGRKLPNVFPTRTAYT